MLVHKRTLGVLDYIFDGDIAGMRQARASDIPGYNPDEWWEVQSGSSLAFKILNEYPWMDPIVDESGKLCDIIPNNPDKLARKAAIQELVQKWSITPQRARLALSELRRMGYAST